MTLQLNRRWLTSVTMSAAATLILTLSACTPPENDIHPPIQPPVDSPPAAGQPAAEQSSEPAAEPAAEQSSEPAAEPAAEQPAAEPSAEPADANEAANQPPTEEPDPFAVPDGSVEELLEYVAGLRTVRPKSNDRAGFEEYRKNIGQAMVTAADRILAKTPTDEQSKEAVVLMLNGLTALEISGDAGAGKRLQALPAELEKAGLSKFIRITKSFSLNGRLQQARGMRPEEIKQLIGEIEKFLAGGPMQDEDVNLAMTAGMMAEDTGDIQWAGEVCNKLGTIVSKNEDKSIASMGAKLIGVGRRINLVGNEMPLDGVTLEGEPLDWSKYEGKVVLVDFWATWCGPCIQEIPNIRKNYDAYHDRGFDVVGISIDRDREALVSFMKNHEEPWLVLYDPDLADSETGEMMSDRYGVFSIPTMALIGTDGKVVAMNPRGPQLGRELEKLLGPAQDKKEELPAPEEKPAADTDKKQ